jgi:hypothetical protein
MNNRSYMLDSLSLYWRRNGELIAKLPIAVALRKEDEPLPPVMSDVALPEWAKHIGINGSLLVPDHCVCAGDEPEWKRTDWTAAAFWYANGLAERAHEKRKGPIHSYSYRLAKWDKRIWSRAWVNRVALFLRKWASVEADKPERELFGELPDTEIILTHDVDAIEKTFPIRIKQSLFHCFNSVRALGKGDIDTSFKKLVQSCRFVRASGDYRLFDDLMALEKRHNKKSIFLFSGGRHSQRKSFREWFFDPLYDPHDSAIKNLVERICAQGWDIGLHPSFNSWESIDHLKKSRKSLEQCCGRPIGFCRQHWMRFSWEKTWKAQQEAGLIQDFTLAFNDASGFRNGAAITFCPWDFTNNIPMKLKVTPTIFMDSQFYDYENMNDEKRRGQIQYWLEEVKAVHGKCAILWHQHVLSEDYGWKKGYEEVLERLVEEE